MNRYYSLYQEEGKREASINIYGDITSWEWLESDVSSYALSKEIESLDVDTLNVFINSYGGEVGEGLAIYNSLKRHKAKIKTHCDGFAASIASVIFMAGEERIMSNASLLFIHNAWKYAAGNANELRKQADDLEAITKASINTYMEYATITEDELKALLDAETWISPQDALDMGFATSITNDGSKGANQSVKKRLIEQLLNKSEPNVPKEGAAIPLLEVEPVPIQAIEPAPDLTPEITPEPVQTPQQNKPLEFLQAIFAGNGVKNEK